ncbi:TRAP transporter large permease [Paracoccus sp. NSM]|uniref:TRAP transporter large permease n=1 Tax=Paracoccus sp. NSM TaxID=3457784 RepID=UPI0040363F84
MPVAIGLAALGLMLVLLALRLPAALAIAAVALPALLLADWLAPVDAVGTFLGGLSDLAGDPDLLLLPLVVALGNLAFYSGVATRLYDAALVWLRPLPGGMAIASVIGCGGFSAISGSSLACASTMGRICVPEMLREGYDPRLATASVAVGGTLGALIPPSVLFILFGLLSATPVAPLFMAGLLPGLLSLAGMILVILWWAATEPEAAPRGQPATVSRWQAALAAWPALLIFAVILGGIQSGWLSAVGAVSLAIALTLAFGLAARRLPPETLLQALRETLRQTAALAVILVAAKLLFALVALTGLAEALSLWVDRAGLSFVAVMLAVVVLHIALGMVLDPVAILVLTLPFMVPLVDLYGMDLIWFGVVLVKLIEIGLITPPVGLNVFVVSNVARGTGVRPIFAGVSRFLFVDLLVLAALVLFPALSLILPAAMG